MTTNVELEENKTEYYEYQDGDIVLHLNAIIPTSEELSKFAEHTLGDLPKVKLLQDEMTDSLVAKFNLDCELVGINNPDELLSSFIQVNAFMAINYPENYVDNEEDDIIE